MNVKQPLDKERRTHRYLDVFSVAWEQKKKKKISGAASREETFQKTGNRRHGGSSYRSDTQ